MKWAREGITGPLVLVACLTVVTLVSPVATAVQQDLRQRVIALNNVTGDETISAQVRAISTDEGEAKKLLAAALTLTKEKDQPLNFNAAYILGQVAVRVKDYDASQVFYRLCVEQAAKLGSERKLLLALAGLERNIQILFADKKYDDSAKLCQEVLEILERERKLLEGGVEREQFGQEVREDILRQWIRSLAKGGKAEDAEKMLDSLLKVRASNWRNVELRAWFYHEIGKLEEAVKTYGEVIDLVEKDREQNWIGRGDRLARLHMTLARIHTALKQPEKAQEHTSKSAQTYEDLLQRVGRSNDMEPQERDAVADEIRYLLSGVYMDLKNVDKSIEYLRQLVERHPDNPTFNNDLGFIMADNDKNLDEAEQMIRKALEEDRKRRQSDENPIIKPEEDKDNAAYLDSLGWVLFKKKEYAEAKKYLLKAIEDKEGQHIEIYDHLGDVHMVLGEKEAALAAWKKGIEAARDLPREQERKIAVEKKLKEHQR
jgi:tetratricopeptide (TPR) repeat protein